MATLPFTKFARYSHMGAEDAEVWNTFIDAHPDYFDDVQYDVRVGVGHPPPPDLDPSYKKMQTDLSQKRIDVIGHNGKDITIIEVKPYVSLSAVGQILLYYHLYSQDFKPRRKPKKMLICIQYDTDIVDFCKRNNISILTV